jgi:hypothetical protein
MKSGATVVAGMLETIRRAASTRNCASDPATAMNAATPGTARTPVFCFKHTHPHQGSLAMAPTLICDLTPKLSGAAPPH